MITNHGAAYRKYAVDPKYVFKSCGNYVVVLEKLPDTITNELRTTYDPRYSKYRANKFLIVLIFNKFDSSITIDKIENSSYEEKICYKKGETVEVNDYNMELTKVYASGIHYFKTIEQAFYWELLKFNPTYTGKWIQWYDDGYNWYEGEYLDGKQTGKWILWYENGDKKDENEYLDGKLVDRIP